MSLLSMGNYYYIPSHRQCFLLRMLFQTLCRTLYYTVDCTVDSTVDDRINSIVDSIVSSTGGSDLIAVSTACLPPLSDNGADSSHRTSLQFPTAPTQARLCTALRSILETLSISCIVHSSVNCWLSYIISH